MRRQPQQKSFNEKNSPNKSGTSQKQIQEALLASEKKYQTLTKNIAVGIFRSTPGSQGRFIEVNPAFIKILGYKNKKEVLSKEVAQIYKNPEDRRTYNDKITKHGFLKNEELILKKKDGSSIIVAETAIAVKDKNGKILFFDGIVEDITKRKKVEEELRIQKTYLEELFNSAPEAIVWHDNNDLIVNVNNEFTRLFGYSRDESIGKPINELVAPEELKKEASLFSKMVINGDRVEADSKRRRKDGKLIDVSILGAPIFHEGNQVGVYAIYRDITARKKAQEELQLQKTYFERLFNSAPEAIVLHGNNDLILDVNAEFTKMFGYTREEAIGKPINDLVASEEILEEAVLISEKVIQGEKIDLDSKRKRKDGSLVDVSILGAPIIHNGEQIGDYAIYRDITDRKKTIEDLQLQKTYLERLFNSAPEAIVWHDNNDIVVNVNDEFTRMFGYSRKEAVGKAINKLVAPDNYKEEAAKYSQTVINGNRIEGDSKRKRKDGTLIDVSILGAPIFHEGEQIGVYAIYRDITERKKAEETRIRQKEEARMAREIQMNFLPKSDPHLTGYDIAGRSIPALNVGGDYYDFIFLDDDCLALSLGDVSGKGLAASLVMSNLQATIRGQMIFKVDANVCLERANHLLFHSTDARTFISLFFGLLDAKNNTLSYANAGQNMPLIFPKNKKTSMLKTHGIALGIKDHVDYSIEEISINPGDTLLIYSDGVSEAMNKRLEEFGESKLQRIVQRNKQFSAKEIIEKIFASVNSHFGTAPQNDDMTVIVVKRVNA